MDSKETKGLYWLGIATLAVVIWISITQHCQRTDSVGNYAHGTITKPTKNTQLNGVTTSLKSTTDMNPLIVNYIKYAEGFGNSWTNNAFIIGDHNQPQDFAGLVKYIQDNANAGGSLQVLLARTNGTPPVEIILLCGVANARINAPHQYISVSSMADNFVYSSVQYSFASNNIPLNVRKDYANLSTLSTIPIGGINTVPKPSSPVDVSHLIRADSAQNFITNYINYGGGNAQTISPTAFSFIIPCSTLNNYIQAATTAKATVSALEFYLGVTSIGRLELMMIGIDASGNNIYINDGKNNYVFEEFMPCPVCNVIGNGPSDIAQDNINSFQFE